MKLYQKSNLILGILSIVVAGLAFLMMAVSPSVKDSSTNLSIPNLSTFKILKEYGSVMGILGIIFSSIGIISNIVLTGFLKPNYSGASFLLASIYMFILPSEVSMDFKIGTGIALSEVLFLVAFAITVFSLVLDYVFRAPDPEGFKIS